MLKTVSSIANAIGALNYKGTWDASTNTPTLTSGAGTKGDYYQVSVAGSTSLDGISNWGVGDVAAFNGATWQRIEGGADLNGVNLTATGTVNFSGATVSDGGSVTTVDINGGTLDGAPIGSSSASTVKSTQLNQSTVFRKITKDPIAINTSTPTEILRLSSTARISCIVKVTFSHRNGFGTTSGSVNLGEFFFAFQNFNNVNAAVSAITNLQQVSLVVVRAIGTTFTFNTIDANTIALEATATGFGSGDSISCSYELLSASEDISGLTIT